MIQIGCIGCGQWGKNLLRVWNETPGARLTAICRQDASRLNELAEQYPDARLLAGVDEMLADPDVHAISIATPPFTHYELIRRALEAGKHVFVEKPMCMNVDEAQLVAKLADAQRCVLMVGHLMEHHGPVRAIKQAVDEERIGKLQHLHFQRLKLGRVRREENVLWSFAPHDLSVVSYLLGTAPDAIRATGHCYVQPGIEDIAFVDATFENGLSVHVHVSWLHPENVRKAIIIGTEGMIIWDDLAPEDKVVLAAKTVGDDLSNIEGETTPLPYPDTQPLQAECESFIQCIETGQRPVNDGWDGVRVVQMLEAASEAIKTGAEVILGQ